jgi:hypothetical protein
MIGVIEHLSTPKKILNETKKFLKNDGHIYIYTHDEFPNIFLDINKQISLVHQLYFTKKTMSALLADVGFSVTRMKTNPGEMNVVAKKVVSSNLSFAHSPLPKTEYNLLKFRYLFYKHVPGVVFTFSRLVKRLFLVPWKCMREPEKCLRKFREVFKNV